MDLADVFEAAVIGRLGVTGFTRWRVVLVLGGLLATLR